MKYLKHIKKFNESTGEYMGSKKKKLIILKKFHENLFTGNFPEGYLSARKELIDTIEWLIAYYENRAGCTPTEYMEALLDNSEAGSKESINLLYNWIKHSRIVGF